MYMYIVIKYISSAHTTVSRPLGYMYLYNHCMLEAACVCISSANFLMCCCVAVLSFYLHSCSLSII